VVSLYARDELTGPARTAASTSGVARIRERIVRRQPGGLAEGAVLR
jgi:hypothetical protein